MSTAHLAADFRACRSCVRAAGRAAGSLPPTASAISTSPRALPSTRSATRTRRLPTPSPRRRTRRSTSPICFAFPSRSSLPTGSCEQSFADYVFFQNSGAEAMECAIKTARKFHAVNGRHERYRIVTFEGAFHGRTLATLAAAGTKKYLDGFGPPVDGFDQVPFGDLDAVEEGIGPRDRRDPDRADPGRGRRTRPVQSIPQGAARTLRQGRPACAIRSRRAGRCRGDGRNPAAARGRGRR